MTDVTFGVFTTCQAAVDGLRSSSALVVQVHATTTEFINAHWFKLGGWHFGFDRPMGEVTVPLVWVGI